MKTRFVSNSNHWRFSPGDFDVQINHEALAAGISASRHATGIFPDGLVFDIPNSDGRRIPFRWPSSSIRTNRRSEVYLGIPNHRIAD